jgi:hypothetical protein
MAQIGIGAGNRLGAPGAEQTNAPNPPTTMIPAPTASTTLTTSEIVCS